MSRKQIQYTDNAKDVVDKANYNFQELYSSQGGGSSSETTTSGDRILNILHFGSSHTEDAWCYVPGILYNYGIRVRMLIFRAAGASFGSLNNLYYTTGGELGYGAQQKGKLEFIDTTDDSETIDGNGHPVWRWWYNGAYTTDFNNDYLLADYTGHEATTWKNIEWDLVTIQHNYDTVTLWKGTHVVDNTDTSITTDDWDGNALNQLIRKIITDLPKPAMFGLSEVFTGHNYLTEWGMLASLANQRNTFNDYPFDIVFPYGAAIANARQVSDWANMTDYDTANGTLSLLENMGVHLQEGLPSYVAASANVEALFRRFYPWLSIYGDVTRPTSDWTSSYNVLDKQGTNVGVTDANIEIAQRIAIMANDYPWGITDFVVTSWNISNATVMGAFPNKGGTNETSGSHRYLTRRHSRWAGRIAPASGYTLSSASWTMDGVTRQIPIDSDTGIATFVIEDVTADVTLTATATT